MSNIVCVSSAASLGCTFVDWSIHFLSGKDQFYSADCQTWIPLSTNPVTKINAHGHKKNHPNGFVNTKQCVEHLSSIANADLLSFYPCPIYGDTVAKSLGLPIDKQLTNEIFQEISHVQRHDYTNLMNYCLDQNLKIVYIALNKKNIFYPSVVRSADRLLMDSHVPQDLNHVKNHYDSLFFQDSIEAWTQQGLTNVWDKRERMALSCRPFDDSIFNGWTFDQTQTHLYIDAQSFWYNGMCTIEKIMSFLELSIDPTRFDTWAVVYANWQKQQLKILEFEFNYQHIIDAIINNWYYDISDLTFEQEVIIQHCLIYQHGLNLKTWKLEKFPANTKELHRLLESNIHTVPSIY